MEEPRPVVLSVEPWGRGRGVINGYVTLSKTLQSARVRIRLDFNNSFRLKVTARGGAQVDGHEGVRREPAWDLRNAVLHPVYVTPARMESELTLCTSHKICS